jgi:hypothetical protein
MNAGVVLCQITRSSPDISADHFSANGEFQTGASAAAVALRADHSHHAEWRDPWRLPARERSAALGIGSLNENRQHGNDERASIELLGKFVEYLYSTVDVAGSR